MTARIHIRRRSFAAIAALALGITIAATIAFATGAFASSTRPVVAGLPLAAPASYPVYLSERTTAFKGWAQMGSGPNSARCDVPGSTCTSPSITVYRWSGSRWTNAYLSAGDRVYVYPFATDWSWVWTSRTGWLAARDSNIIIEWRPYMVAT